MRIAGALTALVLLASCGRGETAAAELVSPCEAVVFEDAPLTHCIADPALHRIRTMLGDPPYRSFAAVAAAHAADAPPVAFAMNGGMYDDVGRPIGYYVENGERLHPINRADGPGNFHLKPNGVFFGAGDTWQVLDTDVFYDTIDERPEFATQSGPMLVIQGKLHPQIDPRGTSLKIRNAVGVDGQGRAHFVIAESPVSFGKLARYFRDELETPNALFLDGSVSQLWDPAKSRRDEGAPLGPLILVERKLPSAASAPTSPTP